MFFKRAEHLFISLMKDYSIANNKQCMLLVYVPADLQLCVLTPLPHRHGQLRRRGGMSSWPDFL